MSELRCPRCGEPEESLSDWYGAGVEMCRDCNIDFGIDALKCEECGQPIGRTDGTLAGLSAWLGWVHRPECSKK